MWRASIALLVVLSTTVCKAELPKTTPQCSKDWGGWWDAYNCGTFPLHWAVASGNMNLTKQLLDAGADINLEDGMLWTPIIEAAFFGKQFISVELIRRGADVYTKGGYLAVNVVKMAKLKWCVEHSHVNTCPTTHYDYDRTIEVIFRGCEWTECEEGFRCVGRRCWPDKCHKVECATNAGCTVENRNPVCRCNPGFVGEDPKTKCEEISGDSKTGIKTGNLVLDPCPEGYYLFGSQCLYIDDMKKVTWKDAAKRCKKKKGVIAKIENPGNFSSYLDEFYPRMSFWVGANDRKKEGVWQWYSGELLTAEFPWGVNQGGKKQPNDGGNNEDCMTLKYFNTELKTQYVDNKCSLKHYYVCTAPRNFVDDLPSVSNSVYNGMEGNNSSTDEAAQSENINTNIDSENSNGNSLTSNNDQNNNSTDGVNQALSSNTNNESQISIVDNGNNNSENANNITSRVFQGEDIDVNNENESSTGNDVSSDINVTTESESSSVNSVTSIINQNDSISNTGKFTRNIVETSNERLE